MYWILFIMGAMASVVIALVVGGLATPRTHVVARTMRLATPRGAVWDSIRAVHDYASWRNEIEDVERVDTDQPQIRWREMTTRRAMLFGAVVDDAPQHFAARILDEDLPFSGEWHWHLDDDAGETRVTITERGAIGNPIFRLIGTYIIGHTKTIDRYLRDLAQKHQQPNATITDAAPRV
ncbi:MAG: SRPBCC family protein [Gemmatimonadaceae bacterium]|nr:SRPBCC family protein [Gemmatimonadaceae bacterium]